MNSELAENLLRKVMGEAANADFPEQLGTLRSLALYKYDEYQQYAPGRQFIESLALWLVQFKDPDERRDALRFIRERLVFTSDNEMRHLVTLMARDHVPTVLRRRVAPLLSLPPYRVAAVHASAEFRRSRRASLFLGMSDGARIDQLRRSSDGMSNEQFATNYELSEPRARVMVDELRTDLHDEKAVFQHVFLVDDFAGSGRTILRHDEGNPFQGRLVRFLHDTVRKLEMEQCPKIYLCLYLATSQALSNLRELIAAYPDAPWSPGNVPKWYQLWSLMTHPAFVTDAEARSTKWTCYSTRFFINTTISR